MNLPSLPTKVDGERGFVQRICDLFAEYDSIFSRTLKPEPSHVTPMELEIDISQWEQPKNSLPPRAVTTAKQVIIRSQIEALLEAGIIRPCNRGYYSQIHMVPKAGGKSWRITIDYRNLNKASKSGKWPLPNISEMLQRIGSRRPRYFAKFDMTSGYHQFPIAEEMKQYTAFTCFMGQFEFNRVPMGIMGAGSHFQMQMASEVLKGLIHHICEDYLDDLLVYGETEQEFRDNLRTVLERLREHNIFINPDKVEVTDSQIEFVGHLLDRDGIHMSNHKTDDIRNFPRPKFYKELKSFLGTTNYFREHVHGYTDLERPLRDMIPNYTKAIRNKKLVWDDITSQAFTAMKDAVANCQKLYFLVEEGGEVFLQTDASDYGIGAYLFQRVGDRILPIRFISKSLSGQQIRWSTPDKEMYAIWYALKKLDHLLRDIQFVIETDHKNLLTEMAGASAKIVRWMLDIQGFDKTIRYIEGPKNEVADSFSRLCPKNVNEASWKAVTEDPEFEQIIAAFEFRKEDTLPADIHSKIAAVHNAVLGHHGVEKTIAKLHRQGEKWQYMRAHVRHFISLCPCCQKMSVLKVPISTHRFTTVNTYRPMNRISVDTIGPFPTDEDGYSHVLTIIDQFTRYVELYPMRDATARSATLPILDFFSRYGIAGAIQSDNGTQFVNEMIERVQVLVGTEHIKTLRYSHEENAVVERANKEVQRHLRALVFQLQTERNWSWLLPMVRRIMNSTVHEAIGTSPASLVLSHTIDLDRGLLLPLESLRDFLQADRHDTLSAWSSSMIAVQQRLLDVAEQQQRKTNENNLIRRRVNPEDIPDFLPNSLVLVAYPDGPLGRRPPTKLNTLWKGPMRVISEEDGVYTLFNFVSDKEEQVHVSSLREYKHDSNSIDPKLIAIRDGGEAVVEAILAHKGDEKRKSTLEFRVRWLGLPETFDLWLPWYALRDNSVLHEYLIANGLAKLINKKHQQNGVNP